MNTPNYYGNLFGVQPWYQDKADFNTDSASYLEFLGQYRKQLDSMIKLIQQLRERDILVEDTKTIDLTKTGEWDHSLDPENSLVEEIKLKADVILSAMKKDSQLNSLLPKPLVVELSNSLKILEDGLYSADLYDMVKALDNHVQTLIDRVDTADPTGAQVMIGGFEQYKSDLVEQRNQMQVKNSLVKDDPNITNLTIVTDIHLRTDLNNFSSRQYYDSIHNIQDVAHETHAVFYMGDNMDGINGQTTEHSANTPAEKVKYANLCSARKVANALVLNEPVDTFMLIGNHDPGGLPYLRDGNPRHEKEVISATELSEIYGNAPYGTHKMPDKNLAVLWLNTMDITFQEMLTYDSGVSDVQLAWLQGQLDSLENDYHIIVMGHHDLNVTVMKNGQKLVDLLEKFEAKETSKFVGYFHGHLHKDEFSAKGKKATFNIISMRQAFPADPAKVGTDMQAGFYVVTINTGTRKAKLNPIGNSALIDEFSY